MDKTAKSAGGISQPAESITEHLATNHIYHGRAEALIKRIEPCSVALSFWSPPYFVGKEYEKGETFDSWQTLLKAIIQGHSSILKPGGFMVINMADILAFPDESIPRFQAMNPSNQRSPVTRRMEYPCSFVMNIQEQQCCLIFFNNAL
jgi:hypothetical protein